MNTAFSSPAQTVLPVILNIPHCIKKAKKWPFLGKISKFLMALGHFSVGQYLFDSAPLYRFLYAHDTKK
ncbi:MAG: hypothetical protein KA155_05215 [Alphaproteobacteria bacterium]|jgi:hypothetical protein|nr:hypothetical protein [Alphaproteobacteria bacterium]